MTAAEASPPAAKPADWRRLEGVADAIAIALAFSLPWSTSVSSALAILWALVVLPTLDLPSVRRVLLSPAGGLPVLMWLLAVLGMLAAAAEPEGHGQPPVSTTEPTAADVDYAAKLAARKEKTALEVNETPEAADSSSRARRT